MRKNIYCSGWGRHIRTYPKTPKYRNFYKNGTLLKLAGMQRNLQELLQ